MAWPSTSAFVAGNVLTAAQLNAIRADIAAANGFVRKTASETVTGSTTQQNDDHLFFTLPGAGSYVFHIHLYVTSAADNTGDIAVGLTFPSGTLNMSGVGGVNTITSGSVGSGEFAARVAQTSGTSATIPFMASTAPTGCHIFGTINATAGGTLQVTWAQFTASGSTTVASNSYMTVQQVA